MTLRTEVLRFRDLRESEACESHTGLRPEQIRSYRAHPYARPDDPAGILLLRDGQLVGKIGMLPGRLRIERTEHRIFWGSDWQVDLRAENRAAAGAAILRAVIEGGGLLGCGPSAAAQPICRAAGFETLRLPRRVVLLRSGPYLRRRLPAALAAPIALLTDIGLAAKVRRPHRHGSHALTVERLPRFDEALDQVDELARPACWFSRDHRELNWAIAHPWLGPKSRYEYRPYYARKTGAVVGYALARLRRSHDMTVGTVMRLAVVPDVDGAAEAMLDRIILDLRAAGADIAEVFTTNDQLIELARRRGMAERGGIEIVAKFGVEVASHLAVSGRSLQEFQADYGEGDALFA